jgi:hypothetical protein
VNKRCFEGAAAPRESGITSAARDTVVATGNNRVMVTTGRDSQPEPTFQPFRYDATGLAGRRMRVVVDHPEDDSGQNSELPPGTTDVVAIDDTPSVFLEMRVHPIDRPEQVAFIRFDQLALYADK